METRSSLMDGEQRPGRENKQEGLDLDLETDISGKYATGNNYYYYIPL